MTAADFTALQARLGISRAELCRRLGIAPNSGTAYALGRQTIPPRVQLACARVEAEAAAAPREKRLPPAQETMLEMLRRPTGATVEEIATATGWKPDTARTTIIRVVRARLGLEVDVQLEPERGRVHRIRASEDAVQILD